MITKDKIQKLKRYLDHPKYGNLLQKAIIGWENITPITLYTGVSCIRKMFIKDVSFNGCCFVGSIVVNETNNTEFFNAETFIGFKYNLNENQVRSIMYGFDDWNGIKNYAARTISMTNSEIYIFANNVGKIIQPEHGCMC